MNPDPYESTNLDAKVLDTGLIKVRVRGSGELTTEEALGLRDWLTTAAEQR